MNREIELTFRAEDLKAIYYKNNQASYTKSPVVRVPCLAFAIGAVLIVCSWVYAAAIESFGPLILPLIFTTVSLFFYLSRASQIYKFRRDIQQLIDHWAQFDGFRLKVSDAGFALEVENRGSAQMEFIERWTSIQSVVIENDHIQLLGKEQFLFPAKAMQPEEFEFLRETINKKMLDGEKKS